MDISQSVKVYTPRPSSTETVLFTCDSGAATDRLLTIPTSCDVNPHSCCCRRCARGPSGRPGGIFPKTTAYCKKVETRVSSRADLFNLRKQVPARPAAALWRAASPGAGGTGRSAARQAPGERRPSVAARSRRAHVA